MPKIYARHPLGYKIELDDVSRERLDESVAWLAQHGYTPDLPGDGWLSMATRPICPAMAGAARPMANPFAHGMGLPWPSASGRVTCGTATV
jgi:hypothetical protein